MFVGSVFGAPSVPPPVNHPLPPPVTKTVPAVETTHAATTTVTVATTSAPVPATTTPVTAPATTTKPKIQTTVVATSTATTSAPLPLQEITPRTAAFMSAGPGNAYGTFVAQTIESYPGSPAFDSLLIELQAGQPLNQRYDYYIYLWDGTRYTFYQTLAPQVKLTFPDGVHKFMIGIDPRMGLCIDGVFAKQISFRTSGIFNGQTVRLTTPTDDPHCALQKATTTPR
jgi:hypothetical protein